MLNPSLSSFPHRSNPPYDLPLPRRRYVARGPSPVIVASHSLQLSRIADAAASDRLYLIQYPIQSPVRLLELLVLFCGWVFIASLVLHHLHGHDLDSQPPGSRCDTPIESGLEVNSYSYYYRY